MKESLLKNYHYMYLRFLLFDNLTSFQGWKENPYNAYHYILFWDGFNFIVG